jgi:hypothetical protein
MKLRDEFDMGSVGKLINRLDCLKVPTSARQFFSVDCKGMKIA